MIKFLLNQSETTIDQIDPNTSVLDYLRDNLNRTVPKRAVRPVTAGHAL